MSRPLPYYEFFHPTDFSESCLSAFHHSLALTVAAQGSLTIFHSGYPNEEYRRERWPKARQTLSRWGLLPPGAPREAVAGLGISIKKLQTKSGDPVAGIHKHAEREESELLVLATHARLGLSRILHKEIATSSMRALKRPALLFPGTAKTLVNHDTGRLKLSRVLIAVDHDPEAGPALRAVARLIATAGAAEGVCREVHVGKTPPLNERPEIAGWSWETKVLAPGNVDDTVTREAVEWNADLIALVSRGRDHLVDVFLGSTLDQLLNGSPCPVLAVPAP